jgi:hypothetical protein
MMEVFVIPSGQDQYVLYYEAAGSVKMLDAAPRGIRGRLKHYFLVMLRSAEAQEEGGTAPVEPGWLGRLQYRLLSWVTGRVVEQRLLWRLRHEFDVTAVHPEDMSFEQVRDLIEQELRNDRDRHRNGLILFTVAFILSGLVAVVPGPNLIAYYFAFRLVGHFLSLRGAVQGLRRVKWNGQGCQKLLVLRDAIDLAPVAREVMVREVAYQLRLPNLPKFFARVVVRHI